MDLNDHYRVISSDCHAGASLDTYGDYVDPSRREEFDEWQRGFTNPFSDLNDTESVQYRRNFDNEIRQQDLEGDGIVAEVLFPNTVPPFFPDGLAFNPPAPGSRLELDLRWAGLHAHNRWLADFCSDLPGRRAGVAQILLEDVERAVAEVAWVADRPGLFGGIMIPNPAVGSSTPQLHSPAYEPIWAACEDLGVVVNTHGGGGGPADYGPFDTSGVMMFLEFNWYCQRPLVRLMFGGVFERHPGLRFVMTENGSGWVPATLAELDYMYNRIVKARPNAVESIFGASVRAQMSLCPSEIWARNCFLGASFLSRRDSKARHAIGLDRVMWGSDYPHQEGTFPHTREVLRHVFHDMVVDEVAMLLGLNAAAVYGFDLEVLRPVADRIGPTVSDLAQALEPGDMPTDSTSIALPV